MFSNRHPIGSFSQDPIGFAAGDANLYRYVGNGPVDSTDPSGLVEPPYLDNKLDFPRLHGAIPPNVPSNLVGQDLADAYYDAEVSIQNRILDQAQQVDFRRRQLEAMKASGMSPDQVMEFENASAEQNLVHRDRIKAEMEWKNKLKARAGAHGVRLGAGLNIYCNVKDIAEFLGPQYEIAEWNHGYFYDPQAGSVFIVVDDGFWYSPKKVYIAGPKMGQEDTITNEQFRDYKAMYHRKFGKYIPPFLGFDGRFIPGTERKTLPIVRPDGTRCGYMDENGAHYP